MTRPTFLKKSSKSTAMSFGSSPIKAITTIDQSSEPAKSIAKSSPPALFKRIFPTSLQGLVSLSAWANEGAGVSSNTFKHIPAWNHVYSGPDLNLSG